MRHMSQLKLQTWPSLLQGCHASAQSCALVDDDEIAADAAFTRPPFSSLHDHGTENFCSWSYLEVMADLAVVSIASSLLTAVK